MPVTPEQLASVMVGRARAEQATWAARAAAVRAQVLQVLARARAEGRLERAWLIGSLATGDFGAGSDVDVVVEGLPRPMEGALRDELERASSLPVDLLRWEELDLGFRAVVLETGEVLR